MRRSGPAVEQLIGALIPRPLPRPKPDADTAADPPTAPGTDRSRQDRADWPAAIIAVVALVLLLKWKIKEPILVGLSAAAGLALHWPW
ncbi:hypothetical protein [Dactylosporangium sp. NPDC005555]|uniref:hypothetical protein n=1 Tax=Dactylosporangium sp. NPDC005555 TaxID=3154889 RepID=UPI0033B1E389